MMREQAHCPDEAADHQLPIAVAIFFTLHLSTDEEHQFSLLIVWPGGVYL